MARTIERVETDASAELLDGQQIVGSLIAGLFTGIAGYVVGLFVGAPLIAAVAGFLVPTALFVVGSALNTVTAGYELREDRVVADGLIAGAEIPYESIGLVVRAETGGDVRSGTADFHLAREGESDQELRNVRNPDRVEAVLDDRVPPAETWLEGRERRDTALQAFVRRRREWAADGEETAVVGPDQFQSLTGVAPSDARLGALDEVTGVESVEDIEAPAIRIGGAHGADGHVGPE